MDYSNATSLTPLATDTVSAMVGEIAQLSEPCATAGEAVTSSIEVAPGVSINAKAEVQTEAEGTELLYTLGESIFSAVAPHMVKLGWSVFPQEKHGNRAPASVFGERIKWAAEHDLKNKRPTAESLKRWVQHAASANVACVFGSASGDTFALDIDVLDETMSTQIAGMADDMLGYTPFRREGRAPKIALIYRQPEGGERRVRNQSMMFAETATDVKGNQIQGVSEHGLEILADGKLLTFHGHHHKTGQYFKWLDGMNSPLVLGPDAAPEVTVEQVEAFIAAVTERFPIWKPPATYGATIAYSDTSGIRMPKITQDYKRGKDGLILDGREELLFRLCLHVVRGNGWQLIEAAAVGDHARDTLIGRLAAAAIKEFAANAATEGRWTPDKLAFEAKGKIARLAHKLIGGKGQVGELRPAPITASDRTLQTPEVQAARRAEQANMPYAALGADNGVYYFVDRLDQVRSFNAKSLEQSSTLNELAAPDYWMSHFGGEKGSYNVSAAANALMEQARECGVYTADDVQGRGAWFVQGKALFHEGSKVYFDGVANKPGRVGGRIFPRAKSMGVDLEVVPLTAEEASMIFKLTNRWTWRNQVAMSELAAGGIAQAVITGAVDWRTHYMVTAEPGSGKTEFMKWLAKVLHGMAVDAMGDSTAKGLAQHLKYDALPIVMDEPETQTEASRIQVQELINLFRKASSESGAKTYKGTSNQVGTTYKNACMGFLAAVNNPLNQEADLTRWVCLDMIKSGDPATRASDWQQTSAIISGLPENFGSRLLARMLKLLPVVRKNTQAFAAAIAKNGGTGRMGMNLGVPLACAHALRSDLELTEAQATTILLGTDWIGETMREAAVSSESDRIIGVIQQQFVRAAGAALEFEITVSEAVSELIGSSAIYPNAPSEIATGLARAGIRVDFDAGWTVSIANDSEAVNVAMKGTQWSKAWSKTISRVEGSTKKKVRFGSRSSNATVLPLHAFLCLTEEELEMEFRRAKEPAVLAYPPKLAVVR